MNTQIIAIANHKGGVAKTTTTAALGGCLNRMGYRVLLVDVDSQHNLTKTFIEGNSDQFDPATQPTLVEALCGAVETLPVYPIRDGLDLVPSRLTLGSVERQMYGETGFEYALRDLLKPVRSSYDYILIDCPPAFSSISDAAFVAATGVLIPTACDSFSTEGLMQVEERIKKVHRCNRRLTVEGVLIVRFHSRQTVDESILEIIRGKYGDLVYGTVIHEAAVINQAPFCHVDICTYSPRSRAAGEYAAFAAEFVSKDGAGRGADDGAGRDDDEE